MVEQLVHVAQMGSTWVLYLLFGLSVLSLSVAFERWVYFTRRRSDPQRLRGRLSSALRQGDLAKADQVLAASRSIEARVVRRALEWRTGGPAAVSDAIDSELGAERRDLDRGLNFLGTIGNNAPFIGLFGTVLGVIQAFQELSGGANKAAMGNVMSGIAEALVATGVGIFVAIPAVIAYNRAQKRIGDVEAATTSLGKLVTAYLQSAASDQREVASGPQLVAVAGEK